MSRTLDCNIARMLSRLGEADGTPVEEQAPSEAREAFEREIRLVDGPAPKIARIEDLQISGPAGPIPARAYMPEKIHAFGALLVYYHGGGYIRGGLESYDSTCRVLADEGHFVVLSVDYRLAPEHPFPAAVEDAYAAARWASANAATLGCRPDRLCVGGDSAGGNLAAVVALIARDRSEFSIAFQMLIYPVIDQLGNTESRSSFRTGYYLDEMSFYTRCYLPNAEDRCNPLASPIYARSLAGLPPALVLTCGFDPLLDEGSDYAARLRKAGVPVEHICFESMIHGFMLLRGLLPQADDGLRCCTAALNRAVGSALR